jgi:hypothetical protein
MISMRLIKTDDLVRTRTQCTFKVVSNKKLFEGTEIKMAMHEIVMSSITTNKQYVICYYEDGHSVEPYNYSKDIISYQRGQ